MDFAEYPTDTDLVSFLKALDIWNDSLTPYASGFVESAVNKFEMLTGYVPFLASTTPVSSYYDPAGSVSQSYYYPWRGGQKNIELDGGFVSISNVIVGWNPSNPGNTMQLPGSPNPNLRFLPINHEQKKVPIDEIEFFFNNWGIPGSVVVVGLRGYSLTVPSDVWYAILYEAAAMFIPSVGILLDDGLVSVKEADVELKWPSDGGILGKQAEAWHKIFTNVVSRYKIIRYMGW